MAASNESNSLAFHLKRILVDKWRSDVTFVVGEGEEVAKQFTAHRLVLSMRSPVFEAMLLGDNWTESKAEQIRILDVTPAAFEEILTYCYETNKVQRTWTTNSEAFDLYFAADKYMLDELKEDCESFLKPQIVQSAASAYAILMFATQNEKEDLEESCYKALAEDANMVIESFAGLSRKHVEGILRHVTFHPIERHNLGQVLCSVCIDSYLIVGIIVETELFASLLQWAKNKCATDKIPESAENLRKVLGKTLFAVHYLKMTPTEFLNGPAASGIFNAEEQLAILANICEPNHCPLPPSLDEIPLDLVKWMKVRRVIMCDNCQRSPQMIKYPDWGNTPDSSFTEDFDD